MIVPEEEYVPGKEDYHGIQLVPGELDKSRRKMLKGGSLKPEEHTISFQLEKT